MKEKGHPTPARAQVACHRERKSIQNGEKEEREGGEGNFVPNFPYWPWPTERHSLACPLKSHDSLQHSNDLFLVCFRMGWREVDFGIAFALQRRLAAKKGKRGKLLGALSLFSLSNLSLWSSSFCVWMPNGQWNWSEREDERIGTEKGANRVKGGSIHRRQDGRKKYLRAEDEASKVEIVNLEANG